MCDGVVSAVWLGGCVGPSRKARALHAISVIAPRVRLFIILVIAFLTKWVVGVRAAIAPVQQTCYAADDSSLFQGMCIDTMISHVTQDSGSTSDHCAACGTPLTSGYFFLHDHNERFCAQCIAARPRCDACAAPVGHHHWQLHDGRVLCRRCHATAIYDPQVAHQLYEETVGAIIAQLGLTLRVGVEFRLVDAPMLAQIRAGAADGHAPDEKTLGLYQRQGRLRAIYMLYGLPKLLFRTVVAHEYAHAWQGETCPLLEDDGLREGFAEWVAYRHLLYLGCTKAAQRMLTSSHPYRPLLDRVLALEQRSGPAGVVQHLLAVGRGA